MANASDQNIKALDKERDSFVSGVIDEFNQSDNILRDWKTRIGKYYELYQMVQKKKHYEGLASLFIPEMLRAVETIVGHVYRMIFSDETWFDYAGRDNNGDSGPAAALTQLTRYEMDQNNFRARTMDSIRQMVIGGLTVRKVLWDFEEVRRKKPSYKDGVRKIDEKIDTIKDTWTFEPVDLLTFQISDINIPYNDVQKAKWIGEQYLVDRQWVKQRIKRGWFSDVEEDKLDQVPEATASESSNDVDRRLMVGGFTNFSKKGKVEIIERWGLVPCRLVYNADQMKELGYDEEDMCEGVVVIANRQAILKLEANPFYHNQKPYVVCPYVPKEYEIPGIGAVQIGESLQEEINDTRNQSMDNKTLVLSTMWLKTRGSGIKNSDLIIRPNGVIQTNDINGLVPLRPPMVANIGTNMEAVAKNDLRESTGAPSNLQGIAQSGVDTATESSAINSAAMGRLWIVAQLYSELVLKPTLVFAEYLNYQFYDHIKVISVVGPAGVKYKQLKPEEIAGGNKDVIIRLSTDATENPAVKRQQLMNFFTAVQTMPPQAIQFHYRVLDKIYGMFFSGHKLEELYPGLLPKSPEELNTPQNERDLVLARQPVKAEEGQNHQAHLEYHEKEFGQMKSAMDDVQFELYTKLIQSHMTLMQQELEQKHMEMIMQDQIMQQEQGASGAGGVNKGSTKNTTPYNATAAPSQASITKDIGA